MTSSVPIPDEAGRQVDQRLVVLRSPFGSYPDLPVAREPGQGSLDIPPRLPEAGAMFGPPRRELRLDAPLPELMAMRLRVRTAIPLHHVGSSSWPAFFPLTGGTSSTSGMRWVTSCAWAPVTVMASGLPVASTRTWTFEPHLRRSVGFGPVFLPPLGAFVVALSTSARDQSIVSAPLRSAKRIS